MNGLAQNVAYANQPEVARQPEVLGEMARLANQCELIDKQMSELEQRLTTVLAQRGDGTAGDSAKNPEPVRVPLAQAIHERVYHLSMLSDKLQSIINRIEV